MGSHVSSATHTECYLWSEIQSKKREENIKFQKLKKQNHQYCCDDFNKPQFICNNESFHFH